MVAKETRKEMAVLRASDEDTILGKSDELAMQNSCEKDSDSEEEMAEST